MSEQGFRKAEAAVSPGASPIESSAIPIDAIKTDVVSYGIYNQGNLPELPIGIFVQEKKDSPIQRLRKYEVVAGIDSGKYYSLLASLQEERTTVTTDRIIAISARFLAAAITKIEGKPLKEVASQAGRNTVDFFKNFWMADILTLLLGIRLSINESFDYAVNTKCPCPENKDIIYGPEETEYNLESVEIKHLLLQEGQKPVFRIDLPSGTTDGQSDIDQLFIEPMRWRHVPEVTNKAKRGTDMFLRQAIQTVVAIPQSEIYGKVKGKPFCQELFNPMGSKDRKSLSDGLNAVQFGPEMAKEMYCQHCDRNFDWQYNWAQMLDFLYNSTQNRQ
jgi:hypothetical protein